MVGIKFFKIVENHSWNTIITRAHLVGINYQVLNLIIKPSNYDFLQTNQKSNCNKLFLETYIYFWNVKYWIKLKQIELTTGLWLWDLCHSSECPLHSPDPESWIILFPGLLPRVISAKFKEIKQTPKHRLDEFLLLQFYILLCV